MLLSDFDQIDKYMIPADVLFSNIHDLKTLESDLSYLTPEQREVIARFWTSFDLDDSQPSEEKKHFGIYGNRCQKFTMNSVRF